MTLLCMALSCSICSNDVTFGVLKYIYIKYKPLNLFCGDDDAGFQLGAVLQSRTRK